MKCPVCHQKAIQFGQWARAENAFHWTCPHCHFDLRGNRVVRATYWLAVVLSLGGACSVLIWRGPKPDWISIALISAVIVGVVLPLGLVAWFFGGYDQVKTDEE
jgi:hypothetical protein